MTMSTYVYPSFKKDVATGVIDLDSDVFGIMLVTDTYTPDVAHDKRNDVTNEVASSGTYVTAVAAVNAAMRLAGVTAVLWGTELRFDATDQSWTGATLSARGCVIYKSRGGAASADELVCALLFSGGADVSSTAGTFTVQFDATGILALT